MSLPWRKVIIVTRNADPSSLRFDATSCGARNSYSFRRAQGVSAVLLRVGERERERVSGVGRGCFREAQHALDHFCDGELLGGAVTDDGLFYFARSDLVNFQAGLGDCGESGAARLAHDHRGLQVLRVEDAFHNADGGLKLFQDVTERLDDSHETA